MNMAKSEVKTMGVIFCVCLLMAIVGIATFIFFNSEAVLIDGVFNFICALSMIAGIKIAVFQNAIISVAIGMVFLLIGFLENTFLESIIPITDSIIVF